MEPLLTDRRGFRNVPLTMELREKRQVVGDRNSGIPVATDQARRNGRVSGT